MEEWEVVHAVGEMVNASEVIHAVGEMVNASTLSKHVPEMNEERSTRLSAIEGCVADSEGGGFLAMMDVQWQWQRRQ